MNLKNQFRCYIGAYYGITSMDNYILKEYVLDEIKNYILNFIEDNKKDLSDINLKNESDDVLNNVSLVTKLQDSLFLLNKINYSMELILLIKDKIKNIK